MMLSWVGRGVDRRVGPFPSLQSKQLYLRRQQNKTSGEFEGMNTFRPGMIFRERDERPLLEPLPGDHLYIKPRL